jgi:hypothetical protein
MFLCYNNFYSLRQNFTDRPPSGTNDAALVVRLPIKCILAVPPWDRLCGLVVRVPGYRSVSPGSIPGATRFSEK